jgi:hypothetical protein
MQTLEPQVLDDVEVRPDPPRRRGRLIALIAGCAAVVLVVAGIAYAVGTSQSTTKTVTTVRTVNTPAAPAGAAAAPTCIKGVAPGSCNIDEATEINIPDKPLTNAQRTLLAQQMVEARAAAMRYPTVADATRAGMILAGAFSPLTGAHYINISGSFGPFNPSNPGSYIYDGTSPTSRIIGLMYLSSTLNPPEGFAGPNDHWHRHTNTCVIFKSGKIIVPFPADSDVHKADCDALRGDFMRRTTWMVHAWVVPGFESPNGVFAHDNVDIKCADGTLHVNKVGFCKGT